MRMTGEVRIAAPRAKVWAALNDPAILKATIPGCTELTRVSETEMTGVVAARIGMVRATFDGRVTLSAVKPLESLTVAGEGTAGAVGSASGSADVVLKEVKGDTVLSYTVQGKVGGKLAQIGTRLIDATAMEVAHQFFSNFGDVVSDNPIVRVEHTVSHVVGEAVEVVEHAAEAVVEAGREAEQEVEGAAVRGVLGGPMAWGLLALMALTALLLFFR